MRACPRPERPHPVKRPTRVAWTGRSRHATPVPSMFHGRKRARHARGRHILRDRRSNYYIRAPRVRALREAARLLLPRSTIVADRSRPALLLVAFVNPAEVHGAL